MLRAAVIGVGSMGKNHARAYRELEGVELVGLVDSNEQTARKVSQTYAAPYFLDLKALLESSRPDFVTLGVPTEHHFELAKELIENGIHVLVEKPISTTLDQGEELVDLAQQKGVILGVGHIERFNPAVMEMRRRLEAGMAGRVYQVRARRLSPFPQRIRDAGVVLDLASHDIDLMLYLLGADLTRVYGETLKTINSDREDMFCGLMRFRSGTVGVLDVNWITPTKIRELTVTGARGMFRCDLLSQQLLFFENDTPPSQWDQLSILRGVGEGNFIGLRIQRHEPLLAELKDFAAAVQELRAPTVTGTDGVETLRIALKFVESGRSAAVMTMGGSS